MQAVVPMVAQRAALVHWMDHDLFLARDFEVLPFPTNTRLRDNATSDAVIDALPGTPVRAFDLPCTVVATAGDKTWVRRVGTDEDHVVDTADLCYRFIGSIDELGVLVAERGAKLVTVERGRTYLVPADDPEEGVVLVPCEKRPKRRAKVSNELLRLQEHKSCGLGVFAAPTNRQRTRRKTVPIGPMHQATLPPDDAPLSKERGDVRV